ncbi:MAG: FMN-binding protein [bacterium]|jgi:uncharacterized protein with FMN-binding domain
MKRFVMSLMIVVLVVIVAGCSVTQGPQQKPAAQKPVAQATYNDGTYQGTSDVDDHGYSVAVVTINKGKISKVGLSEIIELGVEKDFSSYKYEPSVKANKEMGQRFVETNSAEVDDFSGATISSMNYKQAVARALEKAKVNPSVSTRYFDGVFMGKSSDSDYGYSLASLAIVTIENDKVTAVELKEVTENGEFKDYNTYPWQEAVDAHKELPAKFVETNGGPVDNVSGATHSTKSWNEAVANALKLAETK